MNLVRTAHRRPALAAAVALCLALTVPAARAEEGPAAPDQQAEQSPGELAREGMDNLLEAINRLIGMIPQYEMPEVLENGDIIIRRRDPLPESAPEPEGSEPDITETKT